VVNARGQPPSTLASVTVVEDAGAAAGLAVDGCVAGGFAVDGGEEGFFVVGGGATGGFAVVVCAPTTPTDGSSRLTTVTSAIPCRTVWNRVVTVMCSPFSPIIRARQ
jgi:hypothetical protein